MLFCPSWADARFSFGRTSPAGPAPFHPSPFTSARPFAREDEVTIAARVQDTDPGGMEPSSRRDGMMLLALAGLLGLQAGCVHH